MMLTLGALVVLHPRWLRGARRRPVRARAAAGSRRSGWRSARGRSRPWSCSRSSLIRDARPAAQRARGARCADRAAGRSSRSSPPADLARQCPGRCRLPGHRLDEQPGNLHTPLRSIQVLGVWLNGSYKHVPAGGALADPPAASLTLASALLGAVYLLRLRDYALALWLAGADAAGVAGGERVGDHLGRREDADADLAGGRAAGVGGVAALLASPRPSLWRLRSLRARARRRRARLRRAAVPQLGPRADRALRGARRRWTRASPAGGRRCSPTSTNTRCTSCATSTWAVPTSSTRHPPSRPPGRLRLPGRTRQGGAAALCSPTR
jgi:hypothetical protein